MLDRKLAAVFLACNVAASAFAADSGLYVLGALGQSEFASQQTNLDADLRAAGASLTSNFDQYGTGWKVGAGLMFNGYVGFELSYVNLGSAQYTAVYSSGGANATLKASGWNNSLIAVLPFNNQVSVFGKIGEAHTEVTADIRASGGAASAEGLRRTNRWTPSFGGGVSYNLGPQVALRGEFERFSGLRHEHTADEGYANLFSMGLVYRFY
jgi:OmpA-OmpF porin, OOP family